MTNTRDRVHKQLFQGQAIDPDIDLNDFMTTEEMAAADGRSQNRKVISTYRTRLALRTMNEQNLPL